jgi:uncharacterized protein
MHYRKGNNYYFLRLESGEEIVEKLLKFCEIENVRSGYVQAIGAINKAVIGFYHFARKEYITTDIEGDHEITSINGSITELNNSPYLHLHINLADSSNNVIGGHLNEAYVSVTCELIVTVLDGSVGRVYDKELGINLLDV